MWLPHACWPPSSPASILNQIFDSLGIPFRFLFQARRSSAASPRSIRPAIRVGSGHKYGRSEQFPARRHPRKYEIRQLDDRLRFDLGSIAARPRRGATCIPPLLPPAPRFCRRFGRLLLDDDVVPQFGGIKIVVTSGVAAAVPGALALRRSAWRWRPQGDSNPCYRRE